MESKLIRGPNIEVLVLGRGCGVPFEDALKIAEQGRRVLASNSRITKATMSFEIRDLVSRAFACWTGTMTAYVEPHNRFWDSKSVQRIASLDNGYYQIYPDSEFGIRYLFPIHERYLAIRNGLLLCEHPDYDLEHDGKDRIVRPKANKLVDLVEFPAERLLCYLPEPKHGIPRGDPTPGPPGYPGIHLHADHRPRVGPIWCDESSINLVGRPSYNFGVVVEASWIPKIVR